MASILDSIVAQKKLEIKRLYETYDLEQLKKETPPTETTPLFYTALASAKAKRQPFFIAEFKRKSPSEGWINRDADLKEQVKTYARAGAGAISVLTDTEFFGGSYEDLKLAKETILSPIAAKAGALLLQKDFLIDPIQIYLAKQHGADLILLIAAILEPERLEFLRLLAESIGLGVLVEVHDREELGRIQHLDFPVLGINNRDLKTFRTSLNRVNVLARQARGRFVIAESGVKSYRDFQIVRKADGFLIGTGLMNTPPGPTAPPSLLIGGLSGAYFADGRFLFKACGIRTPEVLKDCAADFIGVNFSPVSKRNPSPGPGPKWEGGLMDSIVYFFTGFERRMVDGDEGSGETLGIGANVVAVFYRNSEAEIREILGRFPFQNVQLYADDVTPEFVRSIRKKVFLACRVRETTDLQQIEAFASDVDMFILDGAVPGSGQLISAEIPFDFPYPFLLAGGLHEENLDQILLYENCIGVDIASGIETDGQVDLAKIGAIQRRLQLLLKSKG